MQRDNAGEHGEGGLGADPALLGPGDQQLGGDHHADASMGKQLRHSPPDEHGQLGSMALLTATSKEVAPAQLMPA